MASNLTLRQLRYFITVAELRSFRQAADKLHMSQPPLTQSMKLLEESLGVSLFERDGRGIRPTAAANELIIGGHQIFNVLDRVCDKVRSVGGASVERLVLGMTDDFVFSPLLSRILNFDHTDASAAIDSVSGLSIDLLRQLLDGAIDIALTIDAPRFPKGVEVRNLRPARILALFPVAHSLATAEFVTPKMLSAERLILMPDTSASTFARQCMKIFHGANVDPVAAHHSASAAITQSLVEQGLGVGLVSEFSVRRTAHSTPIPIRSRQALLTHVLLCRSSASAHVRTLIERVTADD